ncbi:hypothetical protein [Natronomonas salsuginis]|uniref:DUF1102 domain-containing protein n=1 Tax=Natronomonas salsuginis TaxID=2217661 RepID=A0A4U5JBW7_9EURY|nr:hypothetical protein [Natronomonas salsuginis]TKR25328.1 hypothetical protein DM868_11220 [Natronomonas salsuginis]
MNRRNVLIGLGGVVAGGGALLGTGAFTTVEAERTVTVNTAGDASALIGLDEAGDGENSNVVDIENGLLVIDFDAAGNNNEGVNLNALTTVGAVTMSGGSLSSVDTAALTIANNGTQTVDISFDIGFDSNQDFGSVAEVSNPGDILKLWTDASGANDGQLGGADDFGNLVASDLVGLGIGESVDVALQIDTTGLDTTDVDTGNPLFESEATITATSTTN